MIPVRVLPNAVEILRKSYPFLEESWWPLKELKRRAGQVVFVHDLDFSRSYNIYSDLEGTLLISGISVTILEPCSLKDKTLKDYL